ncbi:MAG: arginine--tRNA ligase [Maricaulaceae bacterium]|jgi:arginyl-tRNA synthetase
MSDSIAEQLSARTGEAFAHAGLDPALGRTARSDRPDLAPYQCNGALPAGKAAGRNPREIAEEIRAQLAEDPAIESVEVAGPGFLNITPSASLYTSRANALAADARAGAGEVETARRVLIDFGGPNVAKPMHVGHIRSAVIGDSLQRLFKFRGDEVKSDVHLGDWGLQMGHLITELEDEQPDLVYFKADVEGPYPDEPPVSIEDLARLYPQASAKAKEDPERLQRSRRATAELQAGRAGYRALLKHFIDVSVATLKADYGRLGVSFDLWKGESDVDPLVGELVEDFKARGVAEESEGAFVVRVAREDDKKELAPLILVSSEGSALYGTTDLATILDRKRYFDPELVLYVVDLAQADHFEQVFRAAYKAGLAEEGTLEHVKFGTVNGPDGKRLRTREGGTVRLSDLIGQALERARARLEEAHLAEDLGADEREAVAHKVAVAALKFADLQNVRTTNYIFDLDRFTSFEGKTGPYLLYAAVRIKSVMRKAAEAGLAPGEITIETPEERGLVDALDGFDAACAAVYDRRSPHFLCEHAFNLAQAFSKFYDACPIIQAETDAQKASRLALAGAALKQLELALGLLGIEAPERM